MWLELGDDRTRAARARARPARACPTTPALRDRLESFYAEREMWRELGAAARARGRAPRQRRAEAVARLKNAASLYRDQLQDLDGRRRALRKALTIVPDDLSLLGELARNLAASGQHRTAIDGRDAAARRPPADRHRARRPAQGARRAAARGRGARRTRSTTSSGAYALDATGTRAALIDALERRKTAAFTRGETAGERDAVMRLVELHEAGRRRRPRATCSPTGSSKRPTDAEALRALRERDEALGRWDDGVRNCERLHRGRERRGARRRPRSRSPTRASGRQARGRACGRSSACSARIRATPRCARACARCTRRVGAHARARRDPARRRVRRAGPGRRARRCCSAARGCTSQAGDADAALAPLGEAAKLQPDDARASCSMIDISIQLGKLQRADRRSSTRSPRRSAGARPSWRCSTSAWRASRAARGRERAAQVAEPGRRDRPQERRDRLGARRGRDRRARTTTWR